MAWTPEPTANIDLEDDPKKLVAHYLQTINDQFRAQNDSVDRVRFTKFAAQPAKPELGSIYYADGTNWNPGSGEGLYLYNAARAFVFLGVNWSTPGAIGATTPNTGSFTALSLTAAASTPPPVNLVQSGVGSVAFIDGYSGGAVATNHNLAFRAARGTVATPTASQLDDRLGWLNFRGYGTTGFAATARGAITCYAAENWTDTAQGTYFSIFTTQLASASLVERMRIDATGTTTFLGPVKATQISLTNGANNSVIENIPLKVDTTGATITELTTDGAVGNAAVNRIVVPINTTLSVVVNICAKVSGTSGSKQMLRQFLICNNAGATTIEGSVTTLGTDVTSVSLAAATTTITANTVNNCISIQVTGVAATNIRWTAYVVSCNVFYP